MVAGLYMQQNWTAFSGLSSVVAAQCVASPSWPLWLTRFTCTGGGCLVAGFRPSKLMSWYLWLNGQLAWLWSASCATLPLPRLSLSQNPLWFTSTTLSWALTCSSTTFASSSLLPTGAVGSFHILSVRGVFRPTTGVSHRHLLSTAESSNSRLHLCQSRKACFWREMARRQLKYWYATEIKYELPRRRTAVWSQYWQRCGGFLFCNTFL